MPDLQGNARIAHSVYSAKMRERGIPFRREFEEDLRSWMRLAGEVDRLSIDIATFIEAQFAGLKEVRNLTPAALSRKENMAAARGRYFEVCPQTSKSEYAQTLHVMTNQLHSYAVRLIPKYYRNRNGMLHDVNMPFPAWFRVLAAEEGDDLFPAIMENYREPAAEEYTLNIGLRSFLDEIKGEYDASRFWKLIR